MGLSRKQALKRLRGLAEQVQSHLEAIATAPEHSAVSHHEHEIRNWLRQMEEVAPHAGKKTSSEWQAVIETYRASLDRFHGESEA